MITLAWSRHAYAEVVTDQKVATWLGCHRRAFEWFNGVPERLTIDNPKCAITRACYHDPEVQRAYAECAEGYGFKIEPCPVRDPKEKGPSGICGEVPQAFVRPVARVPRPRRRQCAAARLARVVTWFMPSGTPIPESLTSCLGVLGKNLQHPRHRARLIDSGHVADIAWGHSRRVSERRTGVK